MSNQYTHGHHESVLRSHTWRTIDNSARYVLPFLARGTSVLDVGCGPGTITAEMAERVAPGRVVGIDRAESIVSQARADAPPERGNLSYEVGDVFALNFPDQTFDVVHAHQVLQHLDNPVGALREMRRLVKRNGVVAVRDADYGAMRWFPDEPMIHKWLMVYSATARANHAEPDAGRKLRAWAREAGFSSVTTTVDSWCFANKADARWWGSLWADRTQHSAFAEQARHHGLASVEDQAAMADGWRRWMDHEDAFFTVPNTQLILQG